MSEEKKGGVMTGGFLDMNLIIGAAGLIVSVIGLVMVLVLDHINALVRKSMTMLFGTLTLYALFNILEQLTGEVHTEAWATVSRILLFFESAFSALPALIITWMLLDAVGVKDRLHSAVFRIAAGLEIAYFVLLVIAQFTTVIYSIDHENTYRRGPLYVLLLVPPFLILAVNMFAYFKNIRKLTKLQQIAFAAYLFVPLICIVIQMVFYGIYIVLLGTSAAAFIMLVFTLKDQTDRYRLEKEKNAQLNIAILLSQIQPHFLFNCLNVIRKIYRIDVQKGEHALDLFTKYLRHNTDSVASEQPIYFEKELEHVRQYLELQQLRFGGEINVVYEISCTQFRLPPLTLQPLVENAVTYGVRKSRTGMGTVTIRSREYGDRYEVSVTDDGPGFDPEAARREDGKSHIGIFNVRERLLRMSNAALEIASEPGKGTTATIIIPKEEAVC